MWLDSRFRLCPVSDQPLVLHGGEEYGAPFLVERLRRDHPVAWLAVGRGEAKEPIVIGNRLAAAVNEAVAGNLLQHALPYQVHLRTLALRRDQLPPFTLVISGADLAPDFAVAAVEACRSGFGVWLLVESELDLSEAIHLGVEELRMTLSEARELAPRGLSALDVAELHASSGGAYTTFLVEMHEHAELPGLRIPLGDGWVYPEPNSRYELPEDVLEGMLHMRRWTDALEVAAEHVPERVEELLHEAGPEFQQQGLLPRLHILLSMLPADFQDRESTLEWSLVAAHQVGTAKDVLPRARHYLSRFEAPELRSRYAPFAPYEEALREAVRAVEALPTPLTLWQYGRMNPDPTEGIVLLTRSVAQAELEGDAYACARAASTLAARFLHLGDFQAARTWASWGLQLYDEHGLRDGVRRLALYNELAFARMMHGDIGGLKDQLQDLHSTVENLLPRLAVGYRTVLADLERLEGNAQLACEYTHANLATAPRTQKGLRAFQHVRSLLELKRLDEASQVAESAVALSAGVPDVLDLRSKLALGMVQSFKLPHEAPATLKQIIDDGRLVFEQRAMAALHYLLARPEGLAEIPADLREKLQGLSETALRVLSGPPDVFHKVWMGLGSGRNSVLELKVLGRSSARLEGNEVHLTRRHWEILVALALHPEGLDYASLHAFLLHDDDRVSPGTLRSHVSHLRSRVPISDNPYRIDVPFTIDILEVQEYLKAGRIREAVALVNGSVLPRSSLPGIREIGEQLDQALRESVLMSGDAEALYSAAGLWDDDLEVWEASLQALHPRDPRVPLIRARIQTLQREYGTA
ncbi:MAG: helix-turn-helix domain-containing protein [Trueperaceae bacterium]